MYANFANDEFQYFGLLFSEGTVYDKVVYFSQIVGIPDNKTRFCVSQQQLEYCVKHLVCACTIKLNQMLNCSPLDPHLLVKATMKIVRAFPFTDPSRRIREISLTDWESLILGPLAYILDGF